MHVNFWRQGGFLAAVGTELRASDSELVFLLLPECAVAFSIAVLFPNSATLWELEVILMPTICQNVEDCFEMYAASCKT